MVSWVCAYVRTKTVPFKYVQLNVCQVYLNKTAKKIFLKEGGRGRSQSMNPKRGSEGQNQDGDNASYKGENGNQIFPHYYVDLFLFFITKTSSS